MTAALDAPPDASLGAYEEFLAQMEELGLLENLEDELPPGFGAVYEIGRILADPQSRLASVLAPALRLSASGGVPEPADAIDDTDPHIVEVPAGEEYEAEHIRAWSDVRYVYSWQWLLPEEAFLRRLAERTLWFPMAKAPVIRAVETGEDEFSPTPAKQKVYVLLDTSRSMALRHRFALAKAAVLRFLRENRRELGEIHLRTFDVDVGPLRRANDRDSFDQLMRQVARQVTLGNGTCLEKAITTACDDIRNERTVAGAEILVVTDGAARLRIGHLREALGDRIRLHCVKLGHAQVYPTDQWLHDRLELDDDTTTRRGQRIVQLRERKRLLESALRDTHDAGTRYGIEGEIRKIEGEQGEIAAELRQDYGHEIERLAHVYVELDDIDPAKVFALDEAQLEALKELVRRLLEELDATPTPADAMKRAALLMSHLAMLASEQADPVAREFLEQLRSALEHRLHDAMTAHESHVLEGGLLSRADQRDLRVLLHGGTQRGSPLWLVLLRYFYATFARVFRRGDH